MMTASVSYAQKITDSGYRIVGYLLTNPEPSIFEMPVYEPFFREHCKTCGTRMTCNGCSNCGACERISDSTTKEQHPMGLD